MCEYSKREKQIRKDELNRIKKMISEQFERISVTKYALPIPHSGARCFRNMLGREIEDRIRGIGEVRGG